MKPLVTAIQFLTILPLPAQFQPEERDLRRSLGFFPVVGLVLGAILALLDFGVRWTFPPLPASVLIVILMLAISGGFHMDGLADTADGFFSSRPRARILEIMKDSRVGPMGVIAIVCVIALKAAALASVPGQWHWSVVALMPLAGRCALILSMQVLPYARPQGGLGSAFGRPGLTVVCGALVLLSVLGWLLLGAPGLAAAATAIVSTIVFSWWSHRRIGGFTGDTLGAACEIAEIMPALVAASWRWPL